MHIEAFSTMGAALMDSTQELFQSYGFPLDNAPPDSEWDDEWIFASTLGFTGDRVCGALVMAAGWKVLAAWQTSVIGGEATEETLRDTLGEFTNMLLGHVKNKLLSDGIVLILTTPITVCGKQLKLPRPTTATSQWGGYNVNGGRLVVRFDAAFERGFTFASVAPAEAAVSEGNALLF